MSRKRTEQGMANTGTFLPIPMAPRYVMNEYGIIRNTKTGKIIHWRQRGPVTSRYTVVRNEAGKNVCVTYSSLMWMLFGRRIGKTAPIPVTATRGYRQLFFQSCRQCAFALAKSINRSPSTLYNGMVMKKKQIGGWTFEYLM